MADARKQVLDELEKKIDKSVLNISQIDLREIDKDSVSNADLI